MAAQGVETRTSLTGSLEDLTLGEILQIVSLSQRSGVLRLAGPAGEANISILAGKIVHASASSDREGLFAFLLSKRLVDPSRLEAVRDRLREGMDRSELSGLLAELGVPPVSFQQALKRRIEELVYSFFFWEEGNFGFELVDNKSGSSPFPPNALFLEEGINPQFLVMEGARRKDEMKRDNMEGVVLPAAGEEAGREEAAAEPARKDEEERIRAEVGAFLPPAASSRLPEKIAPVAIAVLGSPHLRTRLKEALEKRKVTVLSFPDGATALTGVQDLRSRDVAPLLVLDLKAPGIADGVMLGGLEILSTLWDLGYHLPAVLVADGALPADLPARIAAVPGLELVDVRAGEGGGETALVEAVLGALSPGKGRGRARRKEEFYDIRAELSQDLAELDLPMDSWGGQPLPPAASAGADDPMMETLRSYMGELSRPEASGEITLLALRFASECTGRALLFLARRTDLKGLGQFGVDLGPGRDSNRAIQSLVVSLTPDSVFSRVIRSYQSYRGAPTGSSEEKAIFAAMGGTEPHEIFVGPVVSMGKVAVLLYGDDSPEGRGLPATHALEVFLSHVGLALDRAFLEMKLGARKG
jgi:hypothetical protein